MATIPQSGTSLRGSNSGRGHAIWRLLGSAAWASLAALAASFTAIPVPAVPPDPVLFELRGTPYRIGDLRPKMRELLYRLESEHYRQRLELFNQLIFDALLESESQRTGRSRAELANELLETEAPSEKDARAFYEDNKHRIPEDYEVVRDRIMSSLRSKRLSDKKDAVVEKLRRTGLLHVELTEPPPPPVDIPVEGFPALGPADAPFTIVEFADFACPLCQRAARVMHNIRRDFPDQVRWIFMDFPVSRRGTAARIHQAGHCLQRQGLFWVYHDQVFERLDELTEDGGPSLAREVGADMAAFDQCYASSEPRWAVERSMRVARKLGVTRTPSLFINGRPFASSRLEADLRQLISGQ